MPWSGPFHMESLILRSSYLAQETRGNTNQNVTDEQINVNHPSNFYN